MAFQSQCVFRPNRCRERPMEFSRHKNFVAHGKTLLRSAISRKRIQLKLTPQHSRQAAAHAGHHFLELAHLLHHLLHVGKFVQHGVHRRRAHAAAGAPAALLPLPAGRGVPMRNVHFIIHSAVTRKRAFKWIARDELPTITSNSPGSTTRSMWRSNKARSSGFKTNSTLFFSPGMRWTF